MLHSIVSPNVGHPIVHHFAEGAAVWGQTITPSVAHLVQTHRDISIQYSRIRPGIVFETVAGAAMLPHVVDAKTFRLHAETTPFRQAASRPDIATEALLQCEVADDCMLTLWGRVSAENPVLRWDHPARADRGTTVAVLFTVSFWQISRSADARMQRLIEDCSEKDQRICALETEVARAMRAQ